MSAEPTVLLEKRDRIAYVTLNRPDKHNGLDIHMFTELVQAAKTIREDRSLRCVIMHGAGPSFCAGLDVDCVQRTPTKVARFFIKFPWSKDNMFQRAAHTWRDLPIPVIAAIHGHCLGGGMQIALACDFRIASADAQLSIMEMRWGLIPDMSGTVALSRLTRLDIAQELTMTGRMFSGEEGAGYGLISHLADDPLRAAEELAATLCEQSPDAVAAAKYLFRKTWKKDTWAALFWERLTQLRLLGRKNQRIAMAAGRGGKRALQKFVDRRIFR